MKNNELELERRDVASDYGNMSLKFERKGN
jgi:hypothetical protein